MAGPAATAWSDEILASIWRAYRADTAFVEAHDKRDAQREEALPRLRELVEEYADRRLSLSAFRDQLAAFALEHNHLWGFNSYGMMTVNLLAKGAAGEDEDEVRAAVRPPTNAEEARDRVRLFVTVLQRQKDRAKAGGNPRGGPAPGHAPYVLSFLWEAFDRDAWPIYFPNTRDGLRGMGRWNEVSDHPEDYLAFVAAVAAARADLGVSTWDFEHACAWWAERHFAGFLHADFRSLARIAELNTTGWTGASYASEEIEHEARTSIDHALYQLRWLADALAEAVPELFEGRHQRIASERGSWSGTGRYRSDAWVAIERGDADGSDGEPGFRVWLTKDQVLAGVTPPGDAEAQAQALEGAAAEVATAQAARFELVTASDGELLGRPWESGGGRVAVARGWTAEEAVEAGHAFVGELAAALRQVAPALERWEPEGHTEPETEVFDELEGVPPRAWMIRANVQRTDHLDAWLDGGIVAIGWAESGPIEPGMPKDEVRELLAAGRPDRSFQAITTDLTTVMAFVDEIRPGDLVATPRDGRLYLGTVVSGLYWTPGVDDARRRRIQWHNPEAPVPFDDLPADLAEALKFRRTLRDVSEHRVVLARLAGLVAGDSGEAQLTFDTERVELYVKLADFPDFSAAETLAAHASFAERHGSAWFMANFSIGGRIDEFNAMIADGYHPKLLFAQPGRGLVAVAPILEAETSAEPIPCPDPTLLPDAYDAESEYRTWLRAGRLRRVETLEKPLVAEDFVVASNPSQRASDLLNLRPSYAYLRYAPATVELEDAPLKLPSAERFAQGFARIRERLAVDRDTVERIVANLVAGKSVILTGPTGSGKTELAHLIPQVFFDIDAHVVTATADWTAYEVVGGIFPQLSEDEDGATTMTYGIRRGHVYEAILRNWKADASGNLLRRESKPVRRREQRDGRPVVGTWLVIDEFNRADIDKAFGELFTAIEYRSLPVPIAEPGEPAATRPLPIPQHFRIIGTMNSFDRHYLFTISDALKRRFAFVEVGLPRDTAEERDKVRERVQRRLSDRDLEVEAEALKLAERVLYDFLEFVRVFRPVGVAQAIAALEYAAVRSAQAEPDPVHFLPEALLANLVPQLEGLSTDQLGYARWWADGQATRTVRLCGDALDRRGATHAVRRDAQRVAKYLAGRSDGEAAARSRRISEALDSDADEDVLRALVRGDGSTGGEASRSWAALVGDAVTLTPLPEVAAALQGLVDDAAL